MKALDSVVEDERNASLMESVALAVVSVWESVWAQEVMGKAALGHH